MTTTAKTATVTEADIEKYLAAQEEVSFKYNKAGAKIWYHARAIIGTGAIDNGKFAGWSVDHDIKINRYEAALYLEKYGLTVEQFVAAEKEFYATRYPKDETTSEDNVEVEENTVEKLREKLARLTEKGNKLFRYLHFSDDCKKDRAAFEHEAKLVCSSRFDSAERWQIVNENAARNARLLAAENEYNRIEKECEKLVIAIEAAENTANAEAEQSTAQVEETEQKFFYTTNRGNTREVKVGETGSTTRGMWYFYHEIGGLSEQDVIELATKKESGEFVNALCKFIVNDTDGSEEDDDESFTANVMPAEDDDTDDELIDEPDPQTVERNKGNYEITINGEHVTFRNFSIDEIDANDKLNCSYTRDFFTNRRKFYCGRRRTSAAKIIERYMNGEIAAEQSKAISDFFFAHKLEVGNPFKVCFEITTADGQEHSFMRTFNTFAEAKALVDEFTSTFSEPTLIVIKQNKQGGDWYYSRDVDGSEKFFDAYCKMNSAAEDKAESYKLTKEQIEKRMSEIAIERGEFYDALEEAEADEDISQSHIDYLKGEIDSLMEEYNALWAQLINIKKAEAKTEVTKTEVKPAKADRLDELKDEIDDNEGEIDAAEDNVEVESVNNETPKPTTDEELNQPPTAVEEPADESEPTEVKHGAKFIEGKFYNDLDWETFGAGKKCFKILKRTACYVTIGDYSPFWHNYFENGRYKIQTDSDGNEYTHFWNGERLCAKFLTVDEHIRSCLERAIEIARQKYREYKREGDKAGMRHESELFEICRKAIEELEVA